MHWRKIGILLTGHAPRELASTHGDYDAFFHRLLAHDRLSFHTYPVVDGVFPSSHTDAQGWLITGSRHAVYEPHAWIAPLERLIREIHAATQPLVGVCFGHQIIAQALGGRVERHSGGWTTGPVRYWRDDLGTSQNLLAWHRDQVVEKPAAAQVAGSSPDCAYAVLRYGPSAITYQPHPEFTPGFMRDLAKLRKDTMPASTIRDPFALETAASAVAIAEEMKQLLTGETFIRNMQDQEGAGDARWGTG